MAMSVAEMACVGRTWILIEQHIDTVGELDARSCTALILYLSILAIQLPYVGKTILNREFIISYYVDPLDTDWTPLENL